ncbi:MAG TPA: ATPase, T2SS/T4P/T4SS family [Anaerolineales bacterium]|nr:ATPase, T2SS/T4P/T4SS family [Anaerolineales bacterium]
MPTKTKKSALDILRPLLENPHIAEIMIDGPDHVTIEKGGRIEDTDVHFRSNDEVKEVIREVLGMAGVQIEEDITLYDVRLSDHSRMMAILSPTSINGHSVVFRKWMMNQISWEKLFEYKSVSPEVRELIQSAIRAHISILVAGGTASGKTTVANRIVELIPPEERVVAVEQTHEFQFAHPRSIFLEADGNVSVALNDLLTAGSKMRPDWLVIGELHGAETLHAMQIMGNGHSAISTMHATSAENALARLETLCLMANLGLGLDDIRRIIASALGLIIYLERMPNGRRKIVQMAELKGSEGGRYILQPLMRYNPETETFDMAGAKPGWEK